MGGHLSGQNGQERGNPEGENGLPAKRSRTVKRPGQDPRERRRAPRAEGELDVSVITIRGPLPGQLLDLSLTGCSMLTPGLPQFAINARIAFPAYGLEIRAERRWLRGDKSGWRFLYSDDEKKRLADALTDAVGNGDATRYAKPYSPDRG